MKKCRILIAGCLLQITIGWGHAVPLKDAPYSRPIEALIANDPAWPRIQAGIKEASNQVVILERDPERSKMALLRTQVTTRSTLGAIIYETGGIVINGGVLRILGGGSEKMKRNLPDWNKGKSYKEYGQQPIFLLVADDIFGGFFALNGGGIQGFPKGKVLYLPPSTLEWEIVAETYSEFIDFALNADLNEYYKDVMWPGWEKDLPEIGYDKCMHFYPPLWSKEGQDLSKSIRGIVPEEENWVNQMAWKAKLR